MTLEHKAGVVVSVSFLCLVGTVLFIKMNPARPGDEATDSVDYNTIVELGRGGKLLESPKPSAPPAPEPGSTPSPVTTPENTQTPAPLPKDLNQAPEIQTAGLTQPSAANSPDPALPPATPPAKNPLPPAAPENASGDKSPPFKLPDENRSTTAVASTTNSAKSMEDELKRQTALEKTKGNNPAPESSVPPATGSSPGPQNTNLPPLPPLTSNNPAGPAAGATTPPTPKPPETPAAAAAPPGAPSPAPSPNPVPAPDDLTAKFLKSAVASATAANSAPDSAAPSSAPNVTSNTATGATAPVPPPASPPAPTPVGNPATVPAPASITASPPVAPPPPVNTAPASPGPDLSLGAGNPVAAPSPPASPPAPALTPGGIPVSAPPSPAPAAPPPAVPIAPPGAIAPPAPTPAMNSTMPTPNIDVPGAGKPAPASAPPPSVAAPASVSTPPLASAPPDNNSRPAPSTTPSNIVAQAPAPPFGNSSSAPAPPAPPAIGTPAVVGAPPISVPAPPVVVATPGQPVVEAYDEVTYRSQPGDTFESISKKYYGSEKYGRALVLFNRNHFRPADGIAQDPPVLAVGQPVYIPPMSILERHYGSTIPGGVEPPPPASTPNQPVQTSSAQKAPEPPPGSPTGTKSYRVRAARGEMIADIARLTLGKVDRWFEIKQLNPQIDTAYPVPAGTILRMPADAQIDPANAP